MGVGRSPTAGMAEFAAVRARAALVCGCLLAACGGGGGSLSEDEADDVVDAALEAAVDELDLDETDDPANSGQLLGALEQWAGCGADAVGTELPDELADDSTIVEDQAGSTAVLLAVAYDGDVDDAVRSAVDDDAVDCIDDEITDSIGEDFGDFDIDVEVDDGDVGDASAELDGTLLFGDVEIEFVARMAAVGPVIVVVGAGSGAGEAPDRLEGALEAAVEAAEEALG